MTATQTLREPKTKRLPDVPAPQSQIETDEETPLQWFRRWSRESAERRKQAGLPEESSITMEEIVAICKEARAERYAEEQEQKKATCR
jgi:hypothetical protein